MDRGGAERTVEDGVAMIERDVVERLYTYDYNGIVSTNWEDGGNMKDEFKKIIDQDIAIGKQIIEKHDVSAGKEIHRRLKSKYNAIISGFDGGLHDLFYDDTGEKCLENIKTMIEKLELFKAMEYVNVYSQDASGITINNNNTNSNSVEMNMSFEMARETVENMTALPDSEVGEILLKIQELEKIVKSDERKTKKWENAKPIIKWVADKGIDVGKVLLPLVLQIK